MQEKYQMHNTAAQKKECDLLFQQSPSIQDTATHIHNGMARNKRGKKRTFIACHCEIRAQTHIFGFDGDAKKEDKSSFHAVQHFVHMHRCTYKINRQTCKALSIMVLQTKVPRGRENVFPSHRDVKGKLRKQSSENGSILHIKQIYKRFLLMGGKRPQDFPTALLPSSRSIPFFSL